MDSIEEESAVKSISKNSKYSASVGDFLLFFRAPVPHGAGLLEWFNELRRAEL